MKMVWWMAAIIMLTLAPARVSAQGNPAIRIVSPRADSNVPVGDVKVDVAVENVTLDAEHHWHLYVDGELRSMVGNGATSWTTKIATSGPHEIKVALADEQHDELASATIEVTAAPVEPLTAPFNTGTMAMVMGVFVLVVVSLLFVALKLKPRQA